MEPGAAQAGVVHNYALTILGVGGQCPIRGSQQIPAPTLASNISNNVTRMETDELNFRSENFKSHSKAVSQVLAMLAKAIYENACVGTDMFVCSC